MTTRVKTRTKKPARANNPSALKPRNQRAGRSMSGCAMVERDDIEKLHERINGLTSRVVDLEAQRPHVTEALKRIEASIGRLNGHLAKAVWIILGLFLVALWRIVMAGGIPGI